MIQCPQCSYQNQPAAHFCAKCGRPLGQHPGTQVMTSTIKLVVQIGGNIPPREYPLAAPFITLGRAPNNDIVIPHPFVSGRHAQLERVGSAYRITDLNSMNGLLLNGHRITRHDLANNDLIRIGDAYGNSVTLKYIDASAPLANLQGRLILKQPITLIGRNPNAAMPLNAPTVSWHHARIDFDGVAHQLTDLNSTNGTFVNGVRVQHQILSPNDVVQIGPYQLVYNRSGLSQFNILGNVRLDALHLVRRVPTNSGLRLIWDNVRNWMEGVPTQSGMRSILNDVSLSIQPREFVALVGASGAGKSTLMSALSGFTRAEGTVLINGADFYRDFEAYRAMLGFVPQADIIHRGLPVASALRYAAKLRLPPDSTDAQIDQRVQEVMQIVEIDRQRDQLVSKLSGGQLKRVSIAVELLAQPALFFLDEPTSGLDPGLEKKMMYTLRQLADGGQTIILVTHATANIDQCSKVAFMANGRLVFFGTPDQAQEFFKDPNSTQKSDFADIYTKLSRVDDPNNPDQTPLDWEQLFKQSPYYQQYIAQPLKGAQPSLQAAHAALPRGPKASPVHQWWILTRRHFDLILHDKATLFILLAVMPIIALLVLVIANPNDLVGEPATEIARRVNYAKFGDAQKLLFILSLAATLLGIFASAYEIVREEHIFKRERMVGLGILPYVLSKVSVLFLFSLLQSFFFLIVIGSRVTLPEKGAFLLGPLEMYITLVLATLASIGMGLFISSFARSENMVIYIILLVLFIQILFAGAIFDLPNVAQPLSYATVTHWTMDSLGSTADLRYIQSTEKMNGAPIPKETWSIDYGHTAKHLASRWVVLGGFAVGLIALTCVRQEMKDEL